jgi:choline kinase
MDVTAIVLCAGFGTRLRPLTHCIPKPVVPVGGVPVAWRTIKQILDAGSDVVHCNTHYLPEVVEQELRAIMRAEGYGQDRIRFWHESEILETGGGIARIIHALRKENPSAAGKKPVLAVAGDVFADPPFAAMIKRWSNRPQNTCALMTTRRLLTPRPDVTWVNKQTNQIAGFGKDIEIPAENFEGRVFSTHQLIDEEWVAQSPIVKESSRDIFYRAGLKKGMIILNENYPDENCWFDIGDYNSLAECVQLFGKPTMPTSCLAVTYSPNGIPSMVPHILYTNKMSVLRSAFSLPGGESMSTKLSTLVEQAKQSLDVSLKQKPLDILIAPNDPRLVISADAYAVDLPFPLLLSLEELQGAAVNHNTSSTLLLFPSTQHITSTSSPT